MPAKSDECLFVIDCACRGERNGKHKTYVVYSTVPNPASHTTVSSSRCSLSSTQQALLRNLPAQLRPVTSAPALATLLHNMRVELCKYVGSVIVGAEKSSQMTVPGTCCRYCHGGALSLDECYFEPVSSCSLKDVYGPDVVSAWTKNMDEGALNEARKKLHGDRIYFSAVTGKTEYGQIPPQVWFVPSSAEMVTRQRCLPTRDFVTRLGA